jgi:hypothetical protein
MVSQKYSRMCPRLMQGRCSFLAVLFTLFFASVFAHAELRIQGFDKTGKFVWFGVTPGSLYSIEYVSSLHETNWSTLSSNIIATNGTMAVTLPITNAQRFYRVVQRGSCCGNNGGANILSPVNIGSGCGDETSVPLNQSGCGNAWFKVRINECSTPISQEDLIVTVNLNSPADSDYDLYAYYPGTTPRASSTNPGTAPDIVTVTVPDTMGDNSFDLILEVRRFNGFNCMNWNLTVQFDQ